ncbi:MAG TPA: cytochrome c3 family protein [Thermodesulfovibrionales bacterium]|nr:cytochrome c3 family protein [Thermodesulfovibrionales bacterium]
MKKTVFLIFALSVCLFFAASVSSGNPAKNPDVITLDSLSDKYEAVVFTHERHASMAGNCGTCHHEHGSSGALPCKACHSLTPSAFKNSVTRGFIACKNCHSDFSPAEPKLPGLKVAYHGKCFKCHRGISNVGIDPKGCAELCHSIKELKISKRIK